MIMVKTKAVKFYMREAGFTSQRQLAEVMDVNKDQLNRAINNRKAGLSLGLIDRLCAALKCQPGDILEYAPER